MNDIWEITLPMIASFGGIGAIIVAIVKISGDILAKSLAKRYEHQLALDREQYKKQLEKKNYISKVKFDSEFAIYREMSEATMNMVFKSGELFKRIDELPEDASDQKKVFYKRFFDATKTYNDANRCLMRNAPFIPEDIFKQFSSLRDKCFLQLINYKTFYLDSDWKENRRELRDEFRKAIDRTKIISDELNILMDHLRTYLETLDVFNE